MYVNSPGGSVTAGMAIFDTMRYIRPDVATTCVGLAASMGAFLLSAGHQGKRYTLPNSRIMIHQPLGGAQGQAADIEIQVRGTLARGVSWPLLGHGKVPANMSFGVVRHVLCAVLVESVKLVWGH